MVSIKVSVKIRFKFILFRELKKNFMAPLKIPSGVSLGWHQSKARVVERKAERQQMAVEQVGVVWGFWGW